jgi:hypothetical protein
MEAESGSRQATHRTFLYILWCPFPTLLPSSLLTYHCHLVSSPTQPIILHPEPIKCSQACLSLGESPVPAHSLTVLRPGETGHCGTEQDAVSPEGAASTAGTGMGSLGGKHVGQQQLTSVIQWWTPFSKLSYISLYPFAMHHQTSWSVSHSSIRHGAKTHKSGNNAVLQNTNDQQIKGPLKIRGNCRIFLICFCLTTLPNIPTTLRGCVKKQ